MINKAINERLERNRKHEEYLMKITKMAGYLTDYYIDRAIELDDFSNISSFLIHYFAGSYDISYLVSKYNEFGLNEKIEDIDFNINDWYKIKYEYDTKTVDPETEFLIKMDENEYLQYMIDKRKKEIEE